MIDKLKKLNRIESTKVLQAFELAREEESTGTYGVEKEFAFTRSKDLFPCQKLGRHSTYKFIMDYGAFPDWVKRRTMPEVFDYMIEIMSEPRFSYKEAVTEISNAEAIIWKSLDHIMDEFPNMDEILLSNGTLFKPADIENEHIPEVWGKDKKAYLLEMVKRYKGRLTPQGMHDNLSLPEPLLVLQYQKARIPKKRGNLGFVEFKNEIYVWISCQMRAYAALFIAIGASTPFDYEKDNGKFHTVITGYNSSRWARLPQIESTNYPLMLKDYEHFQNISDQLIEKGIIIGANNYMPIRPKGEKRLGEVPLSLERAAWLHEILLGKNEIETDPLLKPLRGKENEPFITRLELAERTGWLEKMGFKLHDIIEIWQKGNVRRILGIPLNRIEIRCQEAGGNYEFELAKAAFTETLFLFIFCHPDHGASFEYTKDDLDRVNGNEMSATKKGLNGSVIHPYNHKKMNMREFLSNTLSMIEDFSRDLGTYDDLQLIYELAKGEKNEAEKITDRALRSVGRRSESTHSGAIIVPEELIREILRERRQYVLSKLATQLNLDMKLSFLNENEHYGG